MCENPRALEWHAGRCPRKIAGGRREPSRSLRLRCSEENLVKAIFADTFFWVALTNPSDSRYRDAVAVEGMLADTTLFTTDEVLTEFLTFFAGDDLAARPCGNAGDPSEPRVTPGRS
jgi:hypothetical protein